METATNSKNVRYFERNLRDTLVITDRDLELLSFLDELRLMNSHQARALFGTEFVRDRLKRLYHHGYIERIEAQRRVRLHKAGGSDALIMALTNKGARTLRECGQLLHANRNWNERNAALKAWSLPHPLAITEVATVFEVAFRASDIFSLTRHPDTISLLAPGRVAPIYPDLTHELMSGDGQKTIFFKEIDCGNEPNSRKQSSRLQCLRSKFEGYLAYTRSRMPQYEFGTKACRVLTIVTGGETKKQNVADTALKVCNGVGVDRFLVATLEDIKDRSVLDPIWINAAGEERSLI